MGRAVGNATAKPLAEGLHRFGPVTSHTAINPGALAIIGFLLILVGFVLAFYGRKLWTPFMSLVGAIIGGSIGFIVGGFYAPNGYLVALVLGLVGSILGSILFNYLVKIALALIAAAIPATLTYFAMNPNPVADQTAQDPAVIAAILVLLVVFAIAYYFVEELIGVVTALVGGFLLGIGAFLATGNGGLALGGGAVVFLVGAIVQTLAIRTAKKGGVWRLRRARAAANAPVAYGPPAGPPRAPPAPPRTPPPTTPASPPPPPPP